MGTETVTSPMENIAEDMRYERQLLVNNSLGLHARVAARIAQTVQNYQCQVLIAKDGFEADGSSVLSILTLDAPQGSLLTVQTSGPQAAQAMAAMVDLFSTDFGER